MKEDSHTEGEGAELEIQSVAGKARWFLSAEERCRLKTLGRLNYALDLTYDHIYQIHDLYNTAPSLTEAHEHAASLIEAIREVALHRPAFIVSDKRSVPSVSSV